jgi:hypothetical protein
MGHGDRSVATSPARPPPGDDPIAQRRVLCRGGRCRDLDDIEVALSFDKTTGRWSILGDAQDVRQSETRKSILAVLQNAAASISPSDIASATGIERNAIDQQLFRMLHSGEVLSRARGRYAHPHCA